MHGINVMFNEIQYRAMSSFSGRRGLTRLQTQVGKTRSSQCLPSVSIISVLNLETLQKPFITLPYSLESYLKHMEEMNPHGTWVISLKNAPIKSNRNNETTRFRWKVFYTSPALARWFQSRRATSNFSWTTGTTFFARNLWRSPVPRFNRQLLKIPRKVFGANEVFGD